MEQLQNFLRDQLAKLKALQQNIDVLQQAQANEAANSKTLPNNCLTEQLSAIKSLQNDPDYLKNKTAEKLRKQKAAKEKSQAKAERKALGLPDEDPRKRAKAILKARKEKQVIEALRDTGTVLPLRIGELNLEGKIRVRLDSRTEVWAKPGADIEELKRKYLRRESDIKPMQENSADKPYRKAQEILPGEIYNLIRLGEE
jgi:hypothetical protein